MMHDAASTAWTFGKSMTRMAVAQALVADIEDAERKAKLP